MMIRGFNHGYENDILLGGGSDLIVDVSAIMMIMVMIMTMKTLILKVVQ